MSKAIYMNELVKEYDGNIVIPALNTTIKDGEFFTLLGPSGCGKTTLLRMIAGFNSIEGGQISFDDQIINAIPAHKRNIGMVFQNYAIFPHLTVRKNVEYGLKLRGVSQSEMKRRVDEVLEIVKIAEYQDRLPENLSGGQQQRVALARAIVIHPDVLLMDEPLSNLDAKLRVEMRQSIQSIQKKVGITTVYVTHDQEEALAVSDRIAVMNKGRIQQIGSPEMIYMRPFNPFVATFIGHSNLFAGQLLNEDFDGVVKLPNGQSFQVKNLADGSKTQEVVISIRPEEFMVSGPKDPAAMAFTVAGKTFLGERINYELASADLKTMNGEPIQFSIPINLASKIFEVGETIFLSPNAERINLFAKDGEESLMKGVKRFA